MKIEVLVEQHKALHRDEGKGPLQVLNSTFYIHVLRIYEVQV